MSTPPDARRVLLVEDDPALALTVATALEAEGYQVTETSSAEAAIERLGAEDYSVVVSDIYLERKTGLDVLHRARALNPRCHVILMTGKGSMETVIEATRGGAFEYFSKPFAVEAMMAAVKAAFRAAEEREPAARESGTPLVEQLVGNSGAMVEVYKFVSRVAPTDVTVLLRGETGTGKELVARSIHQNSPRAHGRLVVVDCAALPPTLLESELFGVVRGAYTGADRDRPGLFEAAQGGSVFLDEIGEIEFAFQLRLLRFLQEKEVRAVGATASRKVDVRIIAATNKDLRAQVAQGKFREDLWYRLSVATIDLPPLRERRDDIPLLVNFFLEQFQREHKRASRLDHGAMKLLTEYSWPGNVRQLRHVLERLVILTSGPVVDEAAVRAALNSYDATEAAPSKTATDLGSVEEQHIRKVLEATGGNKSRAAAILGIERKTLYRKLEKMR